MNWQGKIKRFVKDNNKKVLFLINVKDSLDKITDFFQEYLPGISAAYQLVFFNAELPGQFLQTEANLRMRSSEDYLSPEDCLDIDDYVFAGLSRRWYLEQNKSSTDYRGIALGRLFEYDLQRYLIPRIKHLQIIRKIIEQEKEKGARPSIVVIEEGQSRELTEPSRIYADFIKTQVLAISVKPRPGRSLPAGLLKARLSLSSLLSAFLDDFAWSRLMKNKDRDGWILIDARLAKYFPGPDNKSESDNHLPFLRCVLEKGLTVRLNLIKNRCPYLSFCSPKNRADFAEQQRYRKEWDSLSAQPDFREGFKYKDIPIWEMVKPQLETFFMEIAPRIINNINRLQRLHQRAKIKLAVLRNDVKELERTVVLGLRLNRIPSLLVQHGILAESNGHSILLADKLAAWGEASGDWYRRFDRTFSFDKFTVTGNPHFDLLVNWQPGLSRRRLCRQLGLPEDKEIVLLATQQINKFSSFWRDDLFLIMASQILSAMQQLDNKQLIIKADPYESVAPYRRRLAQVSSNNAVVVRDIDIYTLIQLSEVVVTLDSTVALEAMLFDKPVITLNLTKRQDRVSYAAAGAALGVYKAEELPRAIIGALTEERLRQQLKQGRTRFIREYAYKIDGKARARLAEVMRQMIK